MLQHYTLFHFFHIDFVSSILLGCDIIGLDNIECLANTGALCDNKLLALEAPTGVCSDDLSGDNDDDGEL